MPLLFALGSAAVMLRLVCRTRPCAGAWSCGIRLSLAPGTFTVHQRQCTQASQSGSRAAGSATGASSPVLSDPGPWDALVGAWTLLLEPGTPYVRERVGGALLLMLGSKVAKASQTSTAYRNYTTLAQRFCSIDRQTHTQTRARAQYSPLLLSGSDDTSAVPL